MDLQAGSKVGNYILDAYLGGGSFGAVWRGHDEATGETVAVKLLTGALSSSDTASMRADVEMLAAAAASRSQHVVKVLGGGSEPLPHIVMEFVDGSDLATQLKDQAVLSAERTVDVGIAITDALRALNEAGIFHRDIKPANVMIDKDGVIKLADFGIAKIVGYETITMTGQAAMTMAYAAPEVWDEDSMFGRPSHKSDLYATGILLYQCLTGATPFRGNYGALYKAHVEKAPDITALPDSTPPSLRLLITRCLEKKQADRPADAAECVAILERARVETAEFAGTFPSGEPRRFGPWQRISPHPTLAWAWRCRHESTGETATVEVHASDDLAYGESLRKAINANARLTTLGAEHLIDSNRLLLAPDEAWQAPPAGAFQFWIAREDKTAGRVENVTLPTLRVALITLASLVDAAAREGTSISPRDLALMPEGHIYARRVGLAKQASVDEVGEGIMAFLRSLSLDDEAREFLGSAHDFHGLVGRARNLGQASTGEVATRLRDDDADQASVMVCRHCHEPIPAGAAFCANCGRSIGRESAGETVAAAAAFETITRQPTVETVRGTTTTQLPPPISLSAVRMQLRKLQNAGDYELTVRNMGALPVDLALSASSDANRLNVQVASQVSLRQGASETLNVKVSPRSSRRFGGKRTTVFTILAGGSGSNEPPVTAQSEFEDQPPAWPLFAGVGVLGVAAAAAIFMFALGGGGGGDDKDGASARVGSGNLGGGNAQTLLPLPTQVPPTPAPVPTPTAIPVAPVLEPAPLPNRADCNAIRNGQPYQSEAERLWFLQNCTGAGQTSVGGSAPAASAPAPSQQASQPQASAPAAPAPAAPVAPAPTERPTMPSVSLTCTSSQSSVTSPPGQQGNMMSANANENIQCSVDIQGTFTSIEWAGGQTRGNGRNFTVAFPFSNTPQNIVLDVNWGGNPVKKTVGVRLLQPPANPNANTGNCTEQQGTIVCIGVGGR